MRKETMLKIMQMIWTRKRAMLIEREKKKKQKQVESNECKLEDLNSVRIYNNRWFEKENDLKNANYMTDKTDNINHGKQAASKQCKCKGYIFFTFIITIDAKKKR